MIENPPEQEIVTAETLQERLDFIIETGQYEEMDKIIGDAIEKRFNIKLDLSTMEIRII